MYLYGCTAWSGLDSIELQARMRMRMASQFFFNFILILFAIHCRSQTQTHACMARSHMKIRLFSQTKRE